MPDFISWAYDPAITGARTTVVLDLVRFIHQGLKGAEAEGLALETQVRAVLFDRTNSPLARPLTRRDYQPAGDTLDLLVKAIESSRQWVAGGAPLGAFHAGIYTDDLQRRLGTTWPPQDTEAPTVTDAYHVACSNLARATSRVVVLFALPDLLNLRSMEHAERLRTHLWQARTHFQRDVLLLGALAGGDRLKEAVQAVAPQVCYSEKGQTNYALMHLLEVDGRSPGHWLTATEDSLRASINQAYEAL